MINLEIQLISKPEITFKEMVDHIATDFPQEHTVTFIKKDPNTGIVMLGLDQETLTDAQDYWLRNNVFSARYIDSHKVETVVAPEKSVTEMSYGELRHQAHWIISQMLDLTKGQLDPQNVFALGYFMAEVDKREDEKDKGLLRLPDNERETLAAVIYNAQKVAASHLPVLGDPSRHPGKLAGSPYVLLPEETKLVYRSAASAAASFVENELKRRMQEEEELRNQPLPEEDASAQFDERPEW